MGIDPLHLGQIGTPADQHVIDGQNQPLLDIQMGQLPEHVQGDADAAFQGIFHRHHAVIRFPRATLCNTWAMVLVANQRGWDHC